MAKQKAGAATGVFTAADYESLKGARRRLNDLVQKCDKATSCGIDTSMYRQMISEMDSQLAAIQQYFMTPPPTV